MSKKKTTEEKEEKKTEKVKEEKKVWVPSLRKWITKEEYNNLIK